MRLLWMAGIVGSGLALRRPRPLYEINGKIALVTGASSGIGASTAKALARAGATVILVARREALLKQLEAEINAKSVATTLVIPADITQEDDLTRLVATVEERFGRLDILINNAGVATGGDYETMSPEHIQRMVNVNVLGTIRMTQHCLPLLYASDSSVIINVSSIAGDIRSPGQVVYGATKAAINGFSEALRRELDDHPIHVGLMMPGFTETDMIGPKAAAILKKARLNNHFFRVDEVTFVADEIVSMIRERRDYWTTGGPLSRFYRLGSRHFPLFSDWAFRYYFNKKKVVDAMRQLIQ